MSLILTDDDRPVPRVANLSARVGQGKVAYPPQFAKLADAPRSGDGEPFTAADSAFVWPKWTALAVLAAIFVAAAIVGYAR